MRNWEIWSKRHQEEHRQEEKSEYYVNGNIRWIKTKELNDRFIFETEEHITEDAVKNSSAEAYFQKAH